MTNNIPTGKLDEAVKNTLSNYEASNENSDWSRMEGMLNAAPASGAFKWSYAIGAVLGLAVIGGGIFLYTSMHSAEKAAPVPAVKTETVTPPAAKPATPLPPAVTTTTPAATTAPATSATTGTPSPETGSNKGTGSKLKTVALKEKSNKKVKTTAPSTNPDDNVIIHQKVATMGDDPIFGDMIDASKGIIGQTQEKDETKKAATTQKGPVAWDTFMTPHVNPDSLRKHRERKDSLKGNH